MVSGRPERGAVVHARLLGPTRLDLGDRVVEEWPRPTARRLVTLLLLAPGHHRRRDELTELLFGHLDPTAGRRALSKALSLARSAVDGPDGPSMLVSDRQGMRLRQDVRVEVDLTCHVDDLRKAMALPAGRDRAHALRDALEATGEALADDANEPWATGARHEVATLRGRARRALAQEEGSRAAWERVFDHTPTDEQAAVHLIEKHRAAGRRDAALQVHARCVQALHDQLGMAPSERLDNAVAGLGTGGSRPVATLPPMVGRDHELKSLVDSVRSTQPVTIIVTGDAGMGKTLLLGHAQARLSEHGWRVAAAVSVPDDRRLPYVALRNAVSQLRAVAPLPPLVRQLVAENPSTAPVDAAAEPGLAPQLEEFLSAAGGVQPVVLTLDDLQWADAATRRLVQRLAATSRRGAWAVLAGWRTADPDAPALELTSTARTIELRGLAPVAVREIARRAGVVSDDVLADLVTRASGNPFFAVELTRANATRGGSAPLVLPTRLVDTLRHRVAACGHVAQRVAALVALAGEDGTHRRLREAAHLLRLVDDEHDQPLDDAIEELHRVHLVRRAEDGLRAHHPLLRDVAELTLSATRRSRLHGALAEAIAGESGHEARLSEARHRLAAYETTRTPELAPTAVRAALAAGQAARSLNGVDAALDLLRTAADIHATLPLALRTTLDEPVGRGLIVLGTICLEVRRDEDAKSALDRALALTADVDARAEAWCQLANLPYRRGDFEGAIELHDRGLQDARDDELASARILGERGWALARLGQREAGREHLERATALLEVAGDWAAAGRAVDRLGAVVGMSASSRDEHRVALALLDRARSLCDRAGLPTEVATVEMHRVRSLEAVGRPHDADRALEEAFRITREAGALYVESTVCWKAAEVAHGRGDLEGALAHRDAEGDILRRCANDHNLVGCELHRTRLLRLLGRPEEADAADAEARAAAHRSGHPALLCAVAGDGRTTVHAAAPSHDHADG